MTFTHALSTNRYGEYAAIVATSAANGTHTTLASAMAACVSGDTIMLRDSVTENVTITPGVNIVGAIGESLNLPSITGTLTMTGAGTSTLSNLRLVTNSAALIAVTGTAASILNVNNCYLNCSNNTGITFSSSDAGAQINLYYCKGNLGTTGIGYFTDSSAGTLGIFYTDFRNTGASTTASTKSAGSMTMQFFAIDSPITYSSSATSSILNSDINSGAQNVTALTTSGTGTVSIQNSHISSGSASAISVGAGTTVGCRLCVVNSSNTNAITGAGTLIYGIQFSGSSSLTNVSTQTGDNFNIGGVSFDGGTNYLSNYTQGTFTPTIDNSTGSPTVTYTTQNGRYTRIGNRVFVSITLVLNTYTAGTGNVQIKTLPFTSEGTSNSVGSVTLVNVTFGASVLYYSSVIGASATLITLQGMRSATTGLNLDAAGPAAGSSIRIGIVYEV